MADGQEPIHPGAFGIEAAVRKLREHLEQLLGQQHRETQSLLTHQQRETHAAHRRIEAALGKLERQLQTMGTQLDSMNEKLTNVANLETAQGVAIQQVVDYLKSNPNPTPTDLTAQLAVLDGIADKLISTTATTLSNLPPTPEPPIPQRRK